MVKALPGFKPVSGRLAPTPCQWLSWPPTARSGVDMAASEKQLEALLTEDRHFPPPPEFKAAATANDPGIYQKAAADPESFWAGYARELAWFEPWTRVLEWTPPHSKWFVGGKLN